MAMPAIPPPKRQATGAAGPSGGVSPSSSSSAAPAPQIKPLQLPGGAQIKITKASHGTGPSLVDVFARACLSTAVSPSSQRVPKGGSESPQGAEIADDYQIVSVPKQPINAKGLLHQIFEAFSTIKPAQANNMKYQATLQKLGEASHKLTEVQAKCKELVAAVDRMLAKDSLNVEVKAELRKVKAQLEGIEQDPNYIFADMATITSHLQEAGQSGVQQAVQAQKLTAIANMLDLVVAKLVKSSEVLEKFTAIQTAVDGAVQQPIMMAELRAISTKFEALESPIAKYKIAIEEEVAKRCRLNPNIARETILKGVISEVLNVARRIPLDTAAAFRLEERESSLQKDWQTKVGKSIGEEVSPQFILDYNRSNFELAGQKVNEQLYNANRGRIPEKTFVAFCNRLFRQQLESIIPQLKPQEKELLRYQVQDLMTQRIFGLNTSMMERLQANYMESGYLAMGGSSNQLDQVTIAGLRALNIPPEALQNRYELRVENNRLRITATQPLVVIKPPATQPVGFDAIKVDLVIDLNTFNPAKSLADQAVGCVRGEHMQLGFKPDWSDVHF